MEEVVQEAHTAGRGNLFKIQREPMSEKPKFYTWAEILEKYPPSEDASTRWEIDRAIYIAGQNLKQVRKKRNVTQTALATLLKVSQNRISQIERGKLDAAQLGTLERYVAALGGELTVSAKFGNETYVLSNNGETSK
jgi:DNA-binding XRE family transcriptional regulator